MRFTLFLVAVLSFCWVAAAQHPWENLNRFLDGILYEFDNTNNNDGWYCWEPTQEPGCKVVPNEVKQIRIAGQSADSLTKTGWFRLARIRCTEMNILTGASVSIDSNKNGFVRERVDFSLSGISVKCEQGVFEWRDVESSGIVGAILWTVVSRTGSVEFKVNPTNRVDRSISVSMGAVFQFQQVTPPGLPTHYQPRELEFETCSLGLNNQVLDFTGGDGLAKNLLTFLLSAIPILFNVIGCAVLKQFGKLDNGQPGLLGLAYDQLVDSMITIAQQQPPFATPLDAESHFIAQGAPDDIEDFSDSFTYSVMSVILNDILGGNTTDSSRLVINDLVDRITENTEGRILIDISDTDITLGDEAGNNVQIGNTIATINNANTFTDLSILKNPNKIYKHTLENVFDLTQLGLGLITTVVIDAKDFIRRVPGAENKLLTLELDVSMLTDDAHAVVTALMASNFTALEKVYVGNVLDYYTENAADLKQTVSCLGQALYQFNVTDFEVQYTDFIIDIRGFIDTGMDQVIDKLNTMITEMFDDLITKLFPNFSRGQIENLNTAARGALNEIYDNGGVSDYCPNSYEGNRSKEISILDWQGPVALNLQDSLDKTISLVDDESLGINRIIRILTQRLQSEIDVVPSIQPGDVYIGNVVAQSASIDNRLSSVSIENLRIGNLDSFFMMDLLNPISSARVRNRFIVGGDPAAAQTETSNPFTLSMQFKIFTDGAFGVDASGEERIWDLTVEFFGLDASIDLDLEVDINRFYPLQIGELTDPACILGSLRSFGVAEFNGTHERTKITLGCDGCGLGSKLLTDAAIEKTTFITNAAFALMRESLSSDDAVAAANKIIQQYSSKCGQTRTVSDFFNLTTLSPTEPLDDVGYTFLFAANSIAYGVVGALLILACCRRTKKSDQKRVVEMLAGDVKSEAPFHSGSYIPGQGEDSMSRATPIKGSEDDASILTSTMDIARFGPSMFLDPNIPRWFKLFMPLVTVSTLAMFLSANLDIGGSVSVIITLENGQEVDLGSLFDFTLTGSINDMWNANVPALAVIVAVASGCWPYVKLILTLLAFIIPPRIVSVGARGKVLSVLDTLGRWSVVDQFLMAIFLIVFAIRVEVPSPNNPEWFLNDILPGDFLTVDVSIVPNWGLYGFLIAAALSIGIGHMVSHYHEKILESAWVSALDPEDALSQKKAQSIANRKEALRTHAFDRQLTDQAREKLGGEAVEPGGHLVLRGYKIRYSQLTGLIVLLGFNVTLIALFGSFLLNTFGFYLRGVGGAAIGWVQPGNDDIQLSLMAAAAGITRGGRDDAHRIGLLSIQITFVLFAMVVPFLRLVCYAILWFAPLSFNDQKRIFGIGKGLKSWSGLDVFVASVVAGYFNIERFAEFMVQPYCSQINLYLEEYGVASGLVTAKEATCFRVEAYLTPLFVVPVVAVITLGLLLHFVHSSCEAALHDREALLKGCHSPYLSHPKTGVPRRQMRTFCCFLQDLSLIRMGFVKPILMIGRKNDETQFRRDSDDMTDRSFAWSERVGDDHGSYQGSFRGNHPVLLGAQLTQEQSPRFGGAAAANPLYSIDSTPDRSTMSDVEV